MRERVSWQWRCEMKSRQGKDIRLSKLDASSSTDDWWRSTIFFFCGVPCSPLPASLSRLVLSGACLASAHGITQSSAYAIAGERTVLSVCDAMLSYVSAHSSSVGLSASSSSSFIRRLQVCAASSAAMIGELTRFQTTCEISCLPLSTAHIIRSSHEVRVANEPMCFGKIHPRFLSSRCSAWNL